MDKVFETFWEEELQQGCAALAAKDMPAAQRWLESAQERAMQTFPENDPRRADACFNLARLYHVMGRLEEGRRLDRQALQRRSLVCGLEHKDTLDSMVCVALFGIDQPAAEDRSLLDRALPHCESIYGDKSWQSLRLRGLLWALGGGDVQVLQSWPLASDSPDEWGRLGDLAAGRCAWPEAAEFYSRSLEYRRHAFGANSLPALQTLAGLGEVQMQMGKEDAARESWRLCLELLDQHFPGHPLAEALRSRDPKPAPDLRWVGFGIEEAE